MKKRGEEFQGSRILLKKAFVSPPSPCPPYVDAHTVYSVFISRVSRVEAPLSFASTREGGEGNKGPIYRRGERSRNDTFAAKLKATPVYRRFGLRW